MFVRKSLRQAALVLAIAASLITACSGGAAAEPTVDVGDRKVNGQHRLPLMVYGQFKSRPIDDL